MVIINRLGSKFIIVALLCAPMFAKATTQAPKTVGLASSNNSGLSALIDEALKNSPDLKASVHKAEQLKSLILPSGSYDDPTLSYEIMNLPVDTYSYKQTPMTGKKLSLSQKIPFPGKLTKKKSMARLIAKAATHDVQQKQYEIILNVKKAFYKLFLEIKNKQVLGAQKKLIKQLIVSARAKYTLGQIPQAEVINFQMEEADLISKILISERKIRVEKSNLASVIGRNTNIVEAHPHQIVKTYLLFKNIKFQSIKDRALKNSHQIRTLEFNHQSASEGLSLAQLQYYPDFALKASYTSREANPIDNGTDFTSMMVSVKLPLLFFQKQSNNIKAAHSHLGRSTSLLNSKKIRVSNKVHNIYYELEESFKTLTLLEDTLLPLSKQAVRTGKSAYLGGRVDYATFLGSIRKRFSTEFRFYSALTHYETLIAELETLLSGPIDPK